MLMMKSNASPESESCMCAEKVVAVVQEAPATPPLQIQLLKAEVVDRERAGVSGLTQPATPSLLPTAFYT